MPNAGYHGGDSFRFTISNGDHQSMAATVNLSVAVGTPTANAQAVSTTQDTPLGLTLTASDDDSPAPVLTYAIVAGQGPAHGTITGFNTSTGALTYTPAAGFSGGDSFQFTVSNGVNASTAAVSITVVSTQSAPAITAQPIPQAVTAGQAATFSAAASGNPAPTVRWQVSTDGGLTFTDIPGATSTTYSFTTSASRGDRRDEFSPLLTNAAGSAPTDAATLTVQKATIAPTVGLAWGTSGAATLQTAADGLRLLPAGRSTDLPWLGINKLTITLSSPEPLSASDVTVTGRSVADYGLRTIDGSGATYTITLARPINAADRVTVTIGSASVATFTRRLDVLPGDVNDDGAVNSQDAVIVRNQYLAFWARFPIDLLFLDVNGRWCRRRDRLRPGPQPRRHAPAVTPGHRPRAILYLDQPPRARAPARGDYDRIARSPRPIATPPTDPVPRPSRSWPSPGGPIMR